MLCDLLGALTFDIRMVGARKVAASELKREANRIPPARQNVKPKSNAAGHHSTLAGFPVEGKLIKSVYDPGCAY